MRLMALCCATAIAGLSGPASRLASAASIQCTEHVFQVSLGEDEPALHEVVGTLCARGPLEGKTVQLLLSGGSYSRIYWDFPYRPQRYSYVRAATRRGYATLNLDRIGVGDSDRPPGALVDVGAGAFVAHQVVAALRAGEVAGVAFDKVMAVAHSLSWFIAIELAAQYPGEVDGAILTGYLHSLNPAFIDIGLSLFYPATFDARFAGQFPGLDYFTTVPGARPTLFYYQPRADPAVIALDEATKDTVALGEFEAIELVDDPTSLLIDVPVLIMIGEHDVIVCGGNVDCGDRDDVRANEEPFFSEDACLEVAVIQNTGHVLNLHESAPVAYARMLAWANRRVGKRPGPAPGPCGHHRARGS